MGEEEEEEEEEETIDEQRSQRNALSLPSCYNERQENTKAKIQQVSKIPFQLTEPPQLLPSVPSSTKSVTLPPLAWVEPLPPLSWVEPPPYISSRPVYSTNGSRTGSNSTQSSDTDNTSDSRIQKQKRRRTRREKNEMTNTYYKNSQHIRKGR